MTFCGTWSCVCFRVWEIKETGEQPTMSYSASLYCNIRKILQFLFLLPCCRFSWQCVSLWTLYNPVVTLRNLRLAFRQLYFMCTKCIHELCICRITKRCYFPVQPLVNGLHNWDGGYFPHGTTSIINTNQVNEINVLKEVSSFGAWRLILNKIDTNVSEESLLPVFRLKCGWKE
jgi:hypothetical protein